MGTYFVEVVWSLDERRAPGVAFELLVKHGLYMNAVVFAVEKCGVG